MSSIQMTISGFHEDRAHLVGQAITEILQNATGFSYPLDLSRLERIIVSNDFDGDFAKLSAELGRNLIYTRNELGACVAKVICYRKGDDYGTVLILASGIANVLLSDHEGHDQEAFHLVHHELCHVHDFNMKAVAFKDDFMKTQLSGVPAFLFPMVETLWDEYFAVRTSATSATRQQVADQVTLLHDTLVQTKTIIDSHILQYRFGGTVNELLDKARPPALFLLQVAAYVRGYLDGGWGQTPEFSQAVEASIQTSYFSPIWERLTIELRQMYVCYPAWTGLAVYDRLFQIVEDYCDLLGWTYKPIPQGVYVNIPIRPGTDPRIVSNG